MLIRNNPDDGYPKYAIIRLDKMREDGTFKEFLEQHMLRADDPVASGYFKYVEVPRVGDPEESFVVKHKDLFAPEALQANADRVRRHAGQYSQQSPSVKEWLRYADEIKALAERSGKNHPNCKVPD